jgi:hypothetical protein
VSASNKGIRPGEPTPVSGQYKPSAGGPEITAVKGKPMPPGGPWDLVDPTKHKK